jgi:amino acid transporter
MSNNTAQLSLSAAIIINLNIIIGSGIFINTTQLAQHAGILGGLSYAIVGTLLLPLILCFAQLLSVYPGGSFYSFCSTSLNPFMGFINAWCYFVTKLSSATLVIHVFVLLMQKTFPALACCDTLMLDMIILSMLASLSLLNIRTGSSIQRYLMILKLFPLFLVIIAGIIFFNAANLEPIHQLWSGIPATIPLVLHAMLGFEAACSISRNIENPQINGPRAVLISYGIVVMLYVAYQTLFYAILGTDLAAQTDYRGAFPLLINAFNISDTARNILGHVIHGAIALSALSAGLGMIYSNMWNLYSLAEQKHVAWFSNVIMLRNRFGIPFLCVLAQAFISFIYMIIIAGEQTTFQQLSAFGSTCTYSLSIIGLIIVLMQRRKSVVVAVLGFINCLILLSASLYAMWCMGNSKPLCIFSGAMVIGIVLYLISKECKREH